MLETAGPAVTRHGGCSEDARARSGRSGTQLPGAAGSAGGPPVELASEPGAGAATPPGQTARQCLRFRSGRDPLRTSMPATT